MTTSVLETNKVRAARVSITDEFLSIELADGRSLNVPLNWFPRLKHGTAEERQDCQIVGGGRGIHWPQLDEDISVVALMNGQKSAETPASIAAWLCSRAAL
jgi:hypothetical protein